MGIGVQPCCCDLVPVVPVEPDAYVGGSEVDFDHTDFFEQSPIRLGSFVGGSEVDFDHTDFNEG